MIQHRFSTGFIFPVLLLSAQFISAFAHSISLPENLVSSSETVQTVKSGVTFGEGPAVDPAGNLYFSDRTPSRIWRVTPTGDASVFRNPADDANGMVFDPEGRLVICVKKGLTRIEKDSTNTTLLRADTLGTEGPNDLTLTSNGGIFFTSSVWGGSGKVFYRFADGKVKTLLSFSYPPLNYPNGLEYIEEKQLLYLCVTQCDSVLKYHVNQDMSLTRIGMVCKVKSPDGLAIDNNGNLWIASSDGGPGVMVYDSTGNKIGKISIDNQSVQNCAFGGPDRKTLYITAKTAVYSVKTIVGGRSTTGIVTGVNYQMIHKKRANADKLNNNSHMKIYTLSGRNIGTYKLSDDIMYSQERTLTIPATLKNRLHSGVYFVQMNTDNSLNKPFFTIGN